MLKIARIVVPFGCVLALVACKADRNEPPITGDRSTPMTPSGEGNGIGTTTITGANIDAISGTSAVSKVVAARCARDLSCNNVGAGKHWATTDVCAQQMRSDMRGSFDAKECPRGVSSKELDECLDAIRKEDCNNPIDTISRIAACSSAELCVSASSPTYPK